MVKLWLLLLGLSLLHSWSAASENQKNNDEMVDGDLVQGGLTNHDLTNGSDDEDDEVARDELTSKRDDIDEIFDSNDVIATPENANPTKRGRALPWRRRRRKGPIFTTFLGLPLYSNSRPRVRPFYKVQRGNGAHHGGGVNVVYQDSNPDGDNLSPEGLSPWSLTGGTFEYFSDAQEQYQYSGDSSPGQALVVPAPPSLGSSSHDSYGVPQAPVKTAPAPAPDPADLDSYDAPQAPSVTVPPPPASTSAPSGYSPPAPAPAPSPSYGSSGSDMPACTTFTNSFSS